MLAVAAIGPFALAAVIRFGALVVTELTAPAVDLRAYYPVITASLVAFGPSIYGFVVGMFVLEDREQGVLVSFRTNPLPGRGYLLYRGITVYVLSVVATLPALAVVGLVEIPPVVLVGGVVVGALGGPLVALGFGTLASNTVEGIALSKLVNLVVLGPAIVVSVVPEPLQFAAGVLPTYWPVKAVVAGILGESSWMAYLGVGTLVQFVWLIGIGRWFVARPD